MSIEHNENRDIRESVTRYIQDHLGSIVITSIGNQNSEVALKFPPYREMQEAIEKMDKGVQSSDEN